MSRGSTGAVVPQNIKYAYSPIPSTIVIVIINPDSRQLTPEYSGAFTHYKVSVPEVF